MPSSPTSVSSKLPNYIFLFITFNSINSWIGKVISNALNIIYYVIKLALLISIIGETLGNCIQLRFIITYETIVVIIFFKISFKKSFCNPIFG